jgi:hypothetical protein
VILQLLRKLILKESLKFITARPYPEPNDSNSHVHTLRAAKPRDLVSIPGRGNRILSSPNHPNLVPHSASYLIGKKWLIHLE